MKPNRTLAEDQCKGKFAEPSEHAWISSSGGFPVQPLAPPRKVTPTVFRAVAAILAAGRVSFGSAETLAETFGERAPSAEPQCPLQPSLPQFGRLVRDRGVDEGLRGLEETRQRARLRDERRGNKKAADDQRILPDVTPPEFPSDLFGIQPKEDEK